jgi:lauroyl/myristoyl acyltransferase
VSRSFYHSYKSFRVVKPNWSRWKTFYYCYLTLKTLIRERRDSLLFLFAGKVRYSTRVTGKKIIKDTYKKGGAVLISTHTSSYPLLAKLHHDYFEAKTLVVPHKAKVFGHLKRKFASLGVKVVPLGGVMKVADRILSSRGSILLYLDAEIPTNHTQMVNMFGRKIELSTSPLWLARKYKIPIIPVYVKRKENVLSLVVHEPINLNQSDKEIMQDVASALEEMILSSLNSWNAYDRFLLSKEPIYVQAYRSLHTPRIKLAFSKASRRVLYLLIFFFKIVRE